MNIAEAIEQMNLGKAVWRPSGTWIHFLVSTPFSNSHKMDLETEIHSGRPTIGRFSIPDVLATDWEVFEIGGDV